MNTPAPRGTAPGVSPPADQLPSARILIVDDNVENVMLLTRILVKAGYTEVSSMTDARAVCAHVEAAGTDLVLLDLHMPHLDGFSVMAQMAHQLGAAPSVILVTGEVHPQIRDEALARGAVDVLTKPFELQCVLAMVERHLRRHQAVRCGD